MKDTYRYFIHDYEDAKWKRPLNHRHGGPSSSPIAPVRSGGAELLAKEFPDGWVYIHLEHRGERE